MEINEWVMIITAVGGFEAVKWGITHFTTRHSFKKRERAAADREEATTDAVEISNEQKRVDWLEKRVNERDTKIDALYIELRNEQRTHLEAIHKLHESQLIIKELEVKRCDVRKCHDRKPPSEY